MANAEWTAPTAREVWPASRPLPVDDEGKGGNLARLAGTYLAVAFVFAGYFKGAAALAWVPVDLTLAFAAACFLVCISVVLGSGSIPRAALTVMVPFVFFLPAVLWAADTPYGSEKVAKLFTLTALSALAPVILVRSEADVRRFLRAIFVICGSIALASVLIAGSSGSGGALRLANPSGDPISLGVAAGAVVVLAAAGAASRTFRASVVASPLVAGLLILLYAGSRGPIAATALAVLAIVIRARGQRQVFLMAGFVLLIGASLWYGWQTAPTQSQQRLEVFATDARGDASTVARANFARVAIDASVRSPLGLGWGGFQGAAADAGFRGVEYPHNIILDALAEGGWIAGAALLAFVGIILRRVVRSATDFVGLAILGLLLLVFMTSMSSGDLNDRDLFLCLGLGLAHSGLFTRGVGTDEGGR